MRRASVTLLAFCFVVPALAQAHPSPNEAYAAAGREWQFTCHLPASAFSSLEEWRLFMERERIRFQTLKAQWEPGLISGAVEIEGAAGKATVHLEASVSPGRPGFHYRLRFDADSAVATSHSDRLRNLPLPSLAQIQNPSLRGRYQRLRLDLVRCEVESSGRLEFTDEDQGAIVHISMHPHTYYDRSGKIAPTVESWAARPGVRTIVLLEGADTGEFRELIAGAPYSPLPPEKIALGIAPRRTYRYFEARNGVVTVSSGGKALLPQNIVFTGGWFDACMSHFVDYFLQEAFRSQTDQEITITLPMGGILAVGDPAAYGMNPLVNSQSTLAELARISTPELLALFEREFGIHRGEWEMSNTYARAVGLVPLALRLTLEDESGRELLRQATEVQGRPRVFVKFRLVP